MTTEPSGQRRDFDKEAAMWDEHPVRVKLARDVAEAMGRQIAFTREMDVLDFGCGTGLVALNLAPFVRSVTGMDTSGGMLDVLRAKVEKQGLTNVRAELIRGEDGLRGSYDAIASSMALHHVEHVEPLLARFFGALRPSGCLCLADLDPDNGEFHGDNTGVFHNGFEREALKAMFRRAGFSRITDATAAEIAKPSRGGELRTFSVFVVAGVRDGG